jgi:hypothetical protein
MIEQEKGRSQESAKENEVSPANISTIIEGIIGGT